MKKTLRTFGKNTILTDMKNTFFEYNPLSNEIIDKLWENAVFVFDTNILLNLYRYSEETSDKFLETITGFKDRVWLPYQVGFEFNRNRLTVISDQRKLYDDFEKRINDIINEIDNKNRNPFFSVSVFEKLLSIKGDIKNEIDNKIKAYQESLITDSLLDKINAVFEGKVGNCFKPEELKKIYIDGEKRYIDKIPPGYCDSKKPENERYGDLIIWKQIISKSKDSKIDVIFVLDDRKEDWWLEHQGKTISPRPELIKEFRIETDKNCHFYKPFQFLEYSGKYLGETIKDEIIEEVKNYTPETIKNDNFILINLTLQGEISNLSVLVNDLKNAGYNVYTEFNSINDLHDVFIALPNIPDLERRLTSKYLSNLVNYGINLIRSIKK